MESSGNVSHASNQSEVSRRSASSSAPFATSSNEDAVNYAVEGRRRSPHYPWNPTWQRAPPAHQQEKTYEEMLEHEAEKAAAIEAATRAHNVITGEVDVSAGGKESRVPTARASRAPAPELDEEYVTRQRRIDNRLANSTQQWGPGMFAERRILKAAASGSDFASTKAHLFGDTPAPSSPQTDAAHGTHNETMAPAGVTSRPGSGELEHAHAGRSRDCTAAAQRMARDHVGELFGSSEAQQSGSPHTRRGSVQHRQNGLAESKMLLGFDYAAENAAPGSQTPDHLGA